MSGEIEDILRRHSHLLAAVAGACGGACIKYFFDRVLRKQEYDLRLWEKIIDKRITAHEDAVEVAIEMRSMVGIGGRGNDGEVRRTPQVLLSKEAFEDWFRSAIHKGLSGSTWLAIYVIREMTLIQDYLVTLHQHLSNIPTESYAAVGEIVRQDFIDLSSNLEKNAVRFFEKDIRTLRISDVNKHHKYQKDETIRRLQNTKLLTRLGVRLSKPCRRGA